MLRSMLTACLLGAAFFAGDARAEAGRLEGAWRGAAVLEGDETPIIVEFEPCADGLCAVLSMPELEYARLPLGPVRQEQNGAYQAGNLTVTLEEDGGLSGALHGHGPAFLDAMGHRGPAQVSLRRGAPLQTAFAEQEVVFRNGDVALAGTLLMPRRPGPHPAIVAVLGSGPATRWPSLGRARRWADQGFAVLIFDKRGAGASGGDWRTASLDDLADDVRAAIAYLSARDDIRADRIGLWAHSQGGWVAPRAIARGAHAAFVVSVAGGGIRPMAIERHDYALTLARLDVAAGERRRAEALVDAYFSYLRGEIGRPDLQILLDEASEASWYRPLGVGRVVPSAQARASWRWVADYDPAPDIAAIGAPVFVALGGGDRPSLTAETVALWRDGLERADAETAIAVFPGVDHHMRVSSQGRGWRRVSAAYRSAVDQFIARHGMR